MPFAKNNIKPSRASHPVARAVRTLALFSLATMIGSASGQGGPPMVTDDPGTPGDGHWEINLGAIATRTQGRDEIAAPDADINYGWGEHVQLKVDIPWVTERQDGEAWKSGLGGAAIGVKWRFIDAESAGFSMSTYPQITSSWLHSSIQRGITEDDRHLFLPVEVATTFGGVSIAAEVGRDLVRNGASQWVAGVVAAHACGEGNECMLETHMTQSPGVRRTLLNFGVHWTLDESVALLAAAGREFGPKSDERQQSLFYLGLQFTR